MNIMNVMNMNINGFAYEMLHSLQNPKSRLDAKHKIKAQQKYIEKIEW